MTDPNANPGSPEKRARCSYEVWKRVGRPDLDRDNVWNCACKLCGTARVLHSTEFADPGGSDAERYAIRSRFAALAWRGPRLPDVSTDPDVMAGAPCITGTRLTVTMVCHRWQHDREAFIQDYPYLTLRHVNAALTYVREHPEAAVAQ